MTYVCRQAMEHRAEAGDSALARELMGCLSIRHIRTFADNALFKAGQRGIEATMMRR